MPCRPRPEAEEAPPRGDTAQRLRTIERWLHHADTVSPETLVRACKVFRERQVRIEHLYHRREGVFPGRELYFFDPSGNRLELRDPTWHAGMPEPTFEELATL